MGNQRKAVVLVHGMGNQVPLTSIREFVENIASGGTQLYSSPDRIMHDYETRRFSYHNRNVDYYEFYWAHLMKEPTMYDIVTWSFNLIFCKNLSARAKKPIWILRIILLGLAVALIISGVLFENQVIEFFNVKNVLASGIGIFIIYKLIYPALKYFFSNLILQSIGDVIRYTMPTPQNIEVRNLIRKKGVELLQKLHDAKNSDGKDTYSDIVLVGHSLGSIVCFDLLTFLFPQYHTKYVYKDHHDQQDIKDFGNQDFYSNDYDFTDYQEKQRKVGLNYRKFELSWKFSDFITLGSPLTHAAMVLANNEAEFITRKNIREFPTCPPSKDPHDEYKYFFEHGPNNFLVPHHAALFTMTRWTNIFYSNDIIGGRLKDIFGKGIKDIELKAEGSWWRRNIPFTSHTYYWNKKEKACIHELDKIV